VRLILLTAGGRAGADFFHSLIDGHPEILQFPGYLRIDSKFKILLKKKNLNDKAELFSNLYPEFFNSKINKFEQWDKLGERRNKSFKVDKLKFKKYFIQLSKRQKKLNNFEILKNLHLAYFLARKKNIKSCKILFVHTHLLSWTKEFVKLFNLKKVDILHTIRHPLSSLSSPISSWLRYEKGKHFFSKDLFFQINKVVNCIDDLSNLGNVHIIQLEKLHLKNRKLFQNFCKKFKIKYCNSLTKSTKNNLLWWGDVLSKKKLNGINKNFKIKIYEEVFFKRDLIFFQCITENIINKYKYKFYYEKKNIIFNLIPMKCEILVWKNTFKNLFFGGFRWKHLISIPFFYLLRIIIINKTLINFKKSRLPNAF
jgi:hypothetical protein